MPKQTHTHNGYTWEQGEFVSSRSFYLRVFNAFAFSQSDKKIFVTLWKRNLVVHEVLAVQ